MQSETRTASSPSTFTTFHLISSFSSDSPAIPSPSVSFCQYLPKYTLSSVILFPFTNGFSTEFTCPFSLPYKTIFFSITGAPSTCCSSAPFITVVDGIDTTINANIRLQISLLFILTTSFVLFSISYFTCF